MNSVARSAPTPMRTTVETPVIAMRSRRWLSLGYAFFVFALIIHEFAHHSARSSSTLPLLVVLLVAAPLTGALTELRAGWQQLYGALLLALDVALAFGIIMVSGGYQSTLWIVLLVPISAAPLILSPSLGVALGALIWFTYGAFFLLAPRALLAPALSDWLLRGAALGIAVVIFERTRALQEQIERRSRRREQALEQFLRVSNSLRRSSDARTVFVEVASAVQASGAFDCVTLSRVNWANGHAQIVVAMEAGNRHLRALEGQELSWELFLPILNESIGEARWVASLPFRAARREAHLLVPLMSQFGEVIGLLTVSVLEKRRRVLQDAAPLLELLANQAAAVLDNAALFNTLEQRVQQTTAELQEQAAALQQAHDRTQTLYHIARALSVALDDQQVLEQSLALVVQASGAERGGLVLYDTPSQRLVFRATLDRQRAGNVQGLERALGLAQWVFTRRETAIVADTASDTRWQAPHPYDNRSRAALAVPLMLDQEAAGVLLLLHNEPGYFGEEHANLALAAASQIAIALSKARLYRHVAAQSDRLVQVAYQREEEASKNMAILRSIGDGVIVGDRLGRVRMINPVAEQLLGIHADDFLGRSLADLPGASNDDTSDTARLRQVVVSDRTVRAHLSPVISAKGEWLGSVVVYRDITEEVLADKLKSEFVATASHELRTPLTSMRGYVDMLLMGTCGPLSEPQRDFVKIIKNNVARLVELIDELLDMSQAEAGEVRLRRELVDLGEMLIDVSRDMYGQFEQRKIALDLEVQDSLPAVQADRQRLRQIVVNLLGNACKYTPTGGHVWVNIHTVNDELRVNVRDTGVGIAREYQQHIFTPFYRADNPLRDEVSGTGLGLSITRKLVEMHGGRIWFESAEGQGSTFSFALPLVKERWKALGMPSRK